MTPPVSPAPHETSRGAAAPLTKEARVRTDAVVARYVQARGGLANLRALRTLRLTGKARFGSGDGAIDTRLGTLQKRPGLVRTEFSFQGLTAVDAYDGKEAWSTEPFGGRREPYRRSADDAKAMARDADIEGPLVDWEAKGHRVEYLGTEELDGTEAHKLRVDLKDGDVEYRYLDPDAMLEIRVVTIRRIRGTEHVTETDLGNYEAVQGVYFPFSVASGRKDAPRSSRITFERAEANVDVDDALFRFPKAGAKVEQAVFAAEGRTPPRARVPVASPSGAPIVDSGVISGIGVRNIGAAAMSGRVSAIAARGDNGKTSVYVGAASGGVWKSLDGGTTFKPIFDKNPVQSIGAIAIDPSHGNTLWVGTGESWTRNSVSIGDGVYKSTDGGESWEKMGLGESERVTKIIVHPSNGSVVYVCVPGKLWSDSTERGVYKTSDGGRSWAQVLKGPNLSTGCSGLSMDPVDPDVLVAGLWDFRRKGWTYRSGGEGPDMKSGSALHVTRNGGASWSELSAQEKTGLPAKPWGRVEVVHAPSNRNVVYALIEAKDSALYRSDDGGRSWARRDSSQYMVWRPFYFARLIVDPKNPDRIFKPDLRLIVSEDGGKSFAPTGGGAHGDWHDLWIDPRNSSHIIGGDDGGLWFSHDGGSRWWKADNLPISQFYHVTADDKDPYQVYGGLQDNCTWVGDTEYPGGVTNARWENLLNSDGFWAVIDPTDPEALYAEGQGGYIARIDRRTHAARDIQPKAGYREKLRFNWNTPIYASPTQRGTLYTGAQFLFRSRDRGDNWERISPDLTTNDPEKQQQELSGGITVDNSSAEMHTTIIAIAESKLDANVLWVGTDDGNLQLSRDGGKSWTNVAGNVPGLLPFSWVSSIEASHFDAGTTYVTFDRHTFGDMTPWVFRTTDYGKTWTRIATPVQKVRGYAHVVREDLTTPKLLFVGTELGLFVSVDGGASFAQFRGRFPSVAVRDLYIHPREHDLVIGTHGRGIWVVDDLTPLRALTEATLGQRAAFLPGRPVQQRMPMQGGWSYGDASFTGENPPNGAVISYYQRARHIFGRFDLEVLDSSGKLVDTVEATARRGVNRVIWSMQVPPPRVPRAAQVAFNATQGARVMPGTYTLRLHKGDEVIETKLDVALDPRAPFTVADRKAQFEASTRVHGLFEAMTTLTSRIDRAHAAVAQRIAALKPGDVLATRLKAAAHKLEETKKVIVATKEGGAVTGEERIREHLDLLYGALLSWEGRPARYQLERIDALARELDDARNAFDTFAKGELSLVDAELRSRGLEAIPRSASGAGAEAPSAQRPPLALGECVRSRGLACETRGAGRKHR